MGQKLQTLPLKTHLQLELFALFRSPFFLLWLLWLPFFPHSYCKFTSVVLVTVAICVTKFESKHLPILVQIGQNNVLYILDLLLTFMAVKMFGTQDGV